MFLSSSKEHALFSLKEEEMLGGTETLKKCVEKPQAIVMVSKVDGTSLLLYTYITVFVCDTGNKAVRMLTSAKGLTPLQSKTVHYANVFRLDKKAKEEDLLRTFEDDVKSVEELVAFLSNHEQEALERTGKRNTNGPNMTMPRCTRQSFLMVLASLTSFTNTLTEIGHGHLLGRVCFESMTTSSRPLRTCLQWLTTLTEERAAWNTICCPFFRRISHFLRGSIHFIRRKLSKRIKGEPPNIKT